MNKPRRSRTPMRIAFDTPMAALAIRIASAGLAFVFSVAIARFVGVEGYGTISILLGMVNIGAVIGSLGLDIRTTRILAAYSSSDPGNEKGFSVTSYRSTAAKVVWALSIAVMVVLFFLIDHLPSNLPQNTMSFIGILLLIPLLARIRLSQGILRGMHKVGTALVPDGVVRPLCGTAALVVAYIVGAEVSDAFVPIMVLSGFIGIALSLHWESGSIKALDGAPPPQQKTRSLNLVSVPLYISSIFAVVLSQGPVLLVGYIAGAVEAGLLSAAQRYAFAAALVSQALFQAISSQLAATYASNNLQEFCRVVRQTTLIAAAITGVVCLILIVGSDYWLGLFGQEFIAANSELRLLLASVVLNAAAGPTGMVLLMTGHERDHFVSLAASTTVTMVLAILLTQSYGAYGAAWAILISTVLWNVIMMAFINRRLAIRPILACL